MSQKRRRQLRWRGFEDEMAYDKKLRKWELRKRLRKCRLGISSGAHYRRVNNECFDTTM